MELVDGGRAKTACPDGPFHWAEATAILMDVCRGVSAAHKAGLIHATSSRRTSCGPRTGS